MYNNPLLVIYQHNKLPKDGLSMCPVPNLGPVIVERSNGDRINLNPLELDDCNSFILLITSFCQTIKLLSVFKINDFRSYNFLISYNLRS